MRRSVAWLALLLLAAAAVVLRRPREPSPVGTAPPPPPATARAAAPPDEPPPVRRDPREQPAVARATTRRRWPPRSLRGTSPDGELTVDDAGHLAVSRGTRQFFDYFLAASGEVPVERIRERLRVEIQTRLPAAPAAEALALLDRYLAYRERARALPPGGDPAAQLAALRALRRETLGSQVADAFFADDEALETAALARQRIAADASLAPEERARRLAAVEDGLPVAVRASRAQVVAPLRLMEEEARLRADGASPAEIHALRQRMFGAEAADRLEALDRERAAWQARLDAYRTARDALVADPALSPAERARAIETLRVDRFTPAERLRVAALDGQGGTP